MPFFAGVQPIQPVSLSPSIKSYIWKWNGSPSQGSVFREKVRRRDGQSAEHKPPLGQMQFLDALKREYQMVWGRQYYFCSSSAYNSAKCSIQFLCQKSSTCLIILSELALNADMVTKLVSTYNCLHEEKQFDNREFFDLTEL